MADPVLQWQLVATDPDRLVKFYGDLFGWQVTAKNALGYRQIETGEGGISGGMWPSPTDGQSFVQLFVGVPDVEESVAKATELGARIVVPPTTLPDGDIMAVLADPCGVTFGVMRRA
jgi:uncharacterized protein